MNFGDFIVCGILGFVFIIFSLGAVMIIQIVAVKWKSKYFTYFLLLLPAFASLFSAAALLKYGFFENHLDNKPLYLSSLA